VCSLMMIDRSKHVAAFNYFNASFRINTIYNSAFVGF
jgi:hypothetical protein